MTVVGALWARSVQSRVEAASMGTQDVLHAGSCGLVFTMYELHKDTRVYTFQTNTTTTTTTTTTTIRSSSSRSSTASSGSNSSI